MEDQLEFNVGNNEKYKVEEIRDNAVNVKKSKAGNLPGLYYLVL